MCASLNSYTPLIFLALLEVLSIYYEHNLHRSEQRERMSEVLWALSGVHARVLLFGRATVPERKQSCKRSCEGEWNSTVAYRCDAKEHTGELMHVQLQEDVCMINDLHLPLQKVAERGQKLDQLGGTVKKVREDAYQMRHNAEMFLEHQQK